MTEEQKSELLIRVDERTERQEKWIDDHAQHHQRLTFAFISTAVSIVLAQAGMIFAMLRVLATSS